MRRGLGVDPVQTALDRALAPIYSGLTRTAIEEAEVRYGPWAVGFVLGVVAFNVILGRKVFAR